MPLLKIVTPENVVFAQQFNFFLTLYGKVAFCSWDFKPFFQFFEFQTILIKFESCESSLLLERKLEYNSEYVFWIVNV